uniref:Uncharacterized protein n=1 Tax=Poecilia formosa TaxID=48698 RepID=A0A096LR33_POEFO
MPQTKKSVSGTSGPSQPGDPEPGDPEPPHPQEVRLGGGGRGGLEPEQGDPDIAKSPSDPKKYRFLELGNGLRVLLISDLSRANENEEGQESSASSDEEEEESDEEEEPELMEVDEEDRTKKKSSEK